MNYGHHAGERESTLVEVMSSTSLAVNAREIMNNCLALELITTKSLTWTCSQVL